MEGELKDNEEEGRLDWKWMKPKEVLALNNLYPAGKYLIEQYLNNK